MFEVWVQSTRAPSQIMWASYPRLIEAMKAAERISDEELVDVRWNGHTILEYTMGDLYASLMPSRVEHMN